MLEEEARPNGSLRVRGEVHHRETFARLNGSAMGNRVFQKSPSRALRCGEKNVPPLPAMPPTEMLHGTTKVEMLDESRIAQVKPPHHPGILLLVTNHISQRRQGRADRMRAVGDAGTKRMMGQQIHVGAQCATWAARVNRSCSP